MAYDKLEGIYKQEEGEYDKKKRGGGGEAELLKNLSEEQKYTPTSITIDLNTGTATVSATSTGGNTKTFKFTKIKRGTLDYLALEGTEKDSFPLGVNLLIKNEGEKQRTRTEVEIEESLKTFFDRSTFE